MIAGIIRLSSIGLFMMSTEDGVRALIKKHFWDMADEDSLSTGQYCVLPEDAHAFFGEYFAVFNINDSSFDFSKYFPQEGIFFLPNAILPDYLKSDKHQPAPLTVKMLIASAKAGRWIDD
ncbi:DUF1493 family protein [Cronobacter sakazakii]|nr:DUF1493 family protein [Cronobacter sakazakii]ELY2472273.1 DUF1493 family protein [Cronobacter sakazakii]ELY3413781.1 DUF1493 family protein [Cronobacter sakazakii]ELY4417657.1 DUF1493 family protein [Cronobacter sakazakii]ELY4752160.1 DUF1493 family protein [Cronobacter sakazakii]